MYAGFWKRVAAYLLDSIFYTIAYYVVLLSLTAVVIHNLPQAKQDLAAGLVSAFVTLGGFLFYFVYLEASSWQATPGKKIMGVKVTDLNGNRISFWRSLGRHLGMTLSSLILGIGYLMCAWTEKKQCLHDMLAGCLVVNDDYVPQAPINAPAPKMAWWAVLLICFPILLLLFGIAAALLMPAFFRSVESGRSNQARVLLQQAALSQQRYYLRHGRYADYWSQLDEHPQNAGNTPTFCTRGPQPDRAVKGYTGCNEQNGWAVTLGTAAATAWRVNNTAYKYHIIQPYAPHTPAQCIGDTPLGKSLCQKLNKRLLSN